MAEFVTCVLVLGLVFDTRFRDLSLMNQIIQLCMPKPHMEPVTMNGVASLLVRVEQTRLMLATVHQDCQVGIGLCGHDSRSTNSGTILNPLLAILGM